MSNSRLSLKELDEVMLNILITKLGCFTLDDVNKYDIKTLIASENDLVSFQDYVDNPKMVNFMGGLFLSNICTNMHDLEHTTAEEGDPIVGLIVRPPTTGKIGTIFIITATLMFKRKKEMEELLNLALIKPGTTEPEFAVEIFPSFAE